MSLTYLGLVLVTISFHRRKVKRNSLHILEKIVSFCFEISVDQNNTPLPTGTGLPPDIEQETFSNLAEAFRECPDCQFPDYLWILQQNGLWPTQAAYDSNTPASLIRNFKSFGLLFPTAVRLQAHHVSTISLSLKP